jgi:hypothetical protein
MKKKRPITTLWYVGLSGSWMDPVVLVSAKPLKEHCMEHRCIRSITAKAAGRRFLRNNLATAMASASYETDNPFSPSYYDLTPEMVKEHKRYEKRATVKVVR